MATNLDLVAIRTTLLAPFVAASVSLGAAVVAYQATPQGKPWPTLSHVVRAVLNLPSRTLFAAEVDRRIEQNGSLVLQWLFAKGTGQVTMTTAIEGTVALYRAQTLAGGITLTGDAQSVRVGVEGDRIRWDVTIPWRTQSIETTPADIVPPIDAALINGLPTTAEALATARNLWLTRIEQAADAEGWAGLRTFYDDEPTFATPPPLPFAGIWLASVGSGRLENQAGTETVVARALVQVHTDPNLGAAAALDITSRICAEHNRCVRGVTFLPVQTERQSNSRAGTFQTNLRVPFRFERLRLT